MDGAFDAKFLQYRSSDFSPSSASSSDVKRRFTACFIAICFAMMAGPSQADPFTHDRIIGFSEDGRYFAYKTFGRGRGSGLPFANVYVVDLDQDVWVAGTPFQAALGEEAMREVETAPYAALDAVRQTVMDAAGPMLRDLRIRRPATVLYAAGIGQAYAAANLTRVDIPNPDDPTAEPSASLSLLLDSFPADGGSALCYLPEATQGFRLTLLMPGADAVVLHEDDRIPMSLGCPMAYRLNAVVSPGYPGPDTVLVAVVSVWREGFEGLDRHVIAVPVPTSATSATPSQIAEITSDSGFEVLRTEFMAGMQAEVARMLEDSLRARLATSSSSPFWPDADLSPATRAVELVAAQSGFPSHGRLWLTEERVRYVPEGVGGPVTVSLITLKAFNLGEARREDLLTSLGHEHVAPPEAFGVGPDLEWRFVMRPVQGMRADIMAAGRRVIDVSEEVACSEVACHTPDPMDLDTQPVTCAGVGATHDSGTQLHPSVATKLGNVMVSLEDAISPVAWLVEFGLWQDEAMQVVAFESGKIVACAIELVAPD